MTSGKEPVAIVVRNKRNYEAAVLISDELARKFPEDKIQANSSVNATIEQKSLSDFGPMKELYNG